MKNLISRSSLYSILTIAILGFIFSISSIAQSKQDRIIKQYTNMVDECKNAKNKTIKDKCFKRLDNKLKNINKKISKLNNKIKICKEKGKKSKKCRKFQRRFNQLTTRSETLEAGISAATTTAVVQLKRVDSTKQDELTDVLNSLGFDGTTIFNKVKTAGTITLKSGISEYEAKKLQKILEDAGATVLISYTRIESN